MPCRFFERDRECPYGDGFRFSHEEPEAAGGRKRRISTEDIPAAGSRQSMPGTDPASIQGPLQPDVHRRSTVQESRDNIFPREGLTLPRKAYRDGVIGEQTRQEMASCSDDSSSRG